MGKKPSLYTNQSLNTTHRFIMSPSYQTKTTTTEQDVLLQEPSPSTRTTMWKKVGMAALVGTAFVVGVNSYGSTIHTPTTDIEAFLSSVNNLSVVDVDETLSCVSEGVFIFDILSKNKCCAGLGFQHEQVHHGPM